MAQVAKNYYPAGNRARFSTNPPKWDAAANPYPHTVQVNGLVYKTTNRYTTGRESPLTETDSLGYRTWTLYTPGDSKHRWVVTPVILLDALGKNDDEDEIDESAYGAGSSAWYWKNRSEDYFAAIPSQEGDAIPASFLSGLETEYELPDTLTDPGAYISPINGGVSDSPRWSRFHDGSDNLITKTWTLDDGIGGTYQVETLDLAGYVVRTNAETGGQYLDITPDSEAWAASLGVNVGGQQGTRPKPPVEGQDYTIKFNKRISVTSPHFIGTQITGYVSLIKQTHTWLTNFSKPDQPTYEGNGFIDVYSPYTYASGGNLLMVGATETTEVKIPISYTIQQKDWLYSPEYDPTPDWFEQTEKVPIDQAWSFNGCWLESVTPGASV